MNATLVKLARKKPFYQRNLPHLCSFYARGCCTRGASCPYRYSLLFILIMYRHELPKESDDSLNKQNIKDRYNGKNDPVAQKILERQRLQEEEDKRERAKVCFGNVCQTIGSIKWK